MGHCPSVTCNMSQRTFLIQLSVTFNLSQFGVRFLLTYKDSFPIILSTKKEFLSFLKRGGSNE